jgi:hypothetical protein
MRLDSAKTIAVAAIFAMGTGTVPGQTMLAVRTGDDVVRVIPEAPERPDDKVTLIVFLGVAGSAEPCRGRDTAQTRMSLSYVVPADYPYGSGQAIRVPLLNRVQSSSALCINERDDPGVSAVQANAVPTGASRVGFTTMAEPAVDPPAAPQPTSNLDGGSANTVVVAPTIRLSETTNLADDLVQTGSISFDARNPQPVKNLIENACRGTPPAAHPVTDELLLSAKSYELINVIKLTGTDQQSIESNNWYVYDYRTHWWEGFHGWQQADFSGSTRLYGAAHIVLVTIVLNKREDGPDIAYKFTVAKETPTNLANAYGLLSVLFPQNATKNAAEMLNAAPRNYWGCDVIPIAWRTSTISVDTRFPATPPSALASVKFVNEPKAWWDVSFAFPIKKASALAYTAGTTTTSGGATVGTLNAGSVSKQNLFAVLDAYLPRVDLKKSVPWFPHPFAGLGLTSKPLQNQLYGVSAGISIADVYVGLLRYKEQATAIAGSTTPPPSEYKNTFSIGVKISVTKAVQLLKGK